MNEKIILDRDVWDSMVKALTEVSAPAFTHNAIQQILGSVYREAAARTVKGNGSGAG